VNILLIGSGGREHALAWKIAQSPLLGTLYISPGNGGMQSCGTITELDVSDHQAVINFAKEKNIELVVIGPEAPLVAGLANDLSTANIPCFGPSKEAAILEGSKGFTKDICKDYNIPTAKYARFTDAATAKDYVNKEGAPIVIKADGLAAGKGVIMAETEGDALTAIDDIFGGSFGDAGAEVVIEETLYGEEASFFVLTDGKNCLPLVTAQDHKRAYDGDEGPNTGGMGAYSPAPIMTDALIEQTMKEIIEPTVKAMNDKGTPYKGVLYAGLMLTEKDGVKTPQLIEYNARFGDPECQVLMMRMKSDIVPALLAVANGTLETTTMEWNDNPALTVVMATKGYPGSYEKGSEIKGLEEADKLENCQIFHAGTKKESDKILAIGGRVLNVTGQGATIAEAQSNAYKAIDAIEWQEGFYRKDIGWRALKA
jgi:phosphoribosylamine--glycine ligase